MLAHTLDGIQLKRRREYKLGTPDDYSARRPLLTGTEWGWIRPTSPMGWENLEAKKSISGGPIDNIWVQKEEKVFLGQNPNL